MLYQMEQILFTNDLSPLRSAQIKKHLSSLGTSNTLRPDKWPLKTGFHFNLIGSLPFSCLPPAMHGTLKHLGRRRHLNSGTRVGQAAAPLTEEPPRALAELLLTAAFRWASAPIVAPLGALSCELAMGRVGQPLWPSLGTRFPWLQTDEHETSLMLYPLTLLVSLHQAHVKAETPLQKAMVRCAPGRCDSRPHEADILVTGTGVEDKPTTQVLPDCARLSEAGSRGVPGIAVNTCLVGTGTRLSMGHF